MKLTSRNAAFLIILLLSSSGSYAVGRSGVDIGRTLVEARCRSGAFTFHSETTGIVTADSENSDSVAPQSEAKTAAANPRPTQVLGRNLVPNPDLEKWPTSAPRSWLTNIYGQNDAKFSVVAGENSSASVRTAITHYSSGTANWYYPAVPVTPGNYYRYSDSYRSDTSTRGVLTITNQAGNISYINLKNAGPSKVWSKYEVEFFVPQDAVTATVYHPLASAGFIELDNVSLLPVQAQGFTHPIVTLTFDDGWASIHNNALPLMKRYGIVSTQYIISGYTGQAKSYANPADLYDFRAAGHEIASHTVDHLDLTKQNDKTLNFQLQRSQQNLTKCFGSTPDFAAPYGTSNATTAAAVARDYQTARSTDVGYNTADNFNPYNLVVQNVSASTTHEQISSWLSVAKANNAWLILVYHQIDDSRSDYARRPSDFERDLQAVKASGVKPETIHQAYTEIEAQLKS